ncbi:NifU N-terminal domain-containing protein, partial [Candidatus Jorgensenbacteria bacterium]|nr:NifU N-terminal domain-containing protein [Candidatus Jorgensenbacteria bacterium]
MKYRITYDDNSASIHIDQKITEQSQLFDSPLDDVDEQPLFIKDIFRIAGVASVTIERYMITIERGLMFAWKDIMPAAIAVVKTYFSTEDLTLPHINAQGVIATTTKKKSRSKIRHKARHKPNKR